jgi:hypothetical protein
MQQPNNAEALSMHTTWIHPNAHALVASALRTAEDRAVDQLEDAVAALRDATNIPRDRPLTDGENAVSCQP